MTHDCSKWPARFLLTLLVVAGALLGQTKLSLGEEDGVVLIQQILRPEISLGGDNAVRLILENRGAQPVRVAKPPSASRFRQYWSWHGFRLEIHGPDGKSVRVMLPFTPEENPPIHDEETAVQSDGSR